MSSTAERIREARERDEARERENDEPDTAGNGEGDGETGEPAAEPAAEPEQPPAAPPQSAPPMSEREAEKGAQKLEAEAARHDKRVREIMGADFEALLPCPACFTPGYVLPPGSFEPEPEQRAALLALAGVEPKKLLKRDPNTVTCEGCDGEGFLDTGSKREGYIEQSCSKCGGQGWHAKELPGQAAPLPPPPIFGQPPFTPAPSNGPGSPPQPFWDVASNSWKLP